VFSAPILETAPFVGKRRGVGRTVANLLKRVDSQRVAVLRVATDLRAPFENN
jgi:hypothetical protein